MVAKNAKIEEVFSIVKKVAQAKSAKEVMDLLDGNFESLPLTANAMDPHMYVKKNTALFERVLITEYRFFDKPGVGFKLLPEIKIEKAKVVSVFGKDFNNVKGKDDSDFDYKLVYEISDKFVSFEFSKELLKGISVEDKKFVEDEERQKKAVEEYQAREQARPKTEDKVLAYVVMQLFDIVKKELDDDVKINGPRKLPMNYLETGVAEKLSKLGTSKTEKQGYSPEERKDAIDFYYKLRDENRLSELSGDLQVIYPGSKILERISPRVEKLDSLKDFVLSRKTEEINLSYYLKSDPAGFFVLGFDANNKIVSDLVKALDDKNVQIFGGAALLLGRIEDKNSFEKLLKKLEEVKKLAKQNSGTYSEPRAWAGESEPTYNPSDYELAESIIGDAIISVVKKNELKKTGKISFNRFMSSHIDVVGSARLFYWTKMEVEFDLATHLEKSNSDLNSGFIKG